MNGQIIKTTRGSLRVKTCLDWGAQGEVYETDDPEHLLKVYKPCDVDDPDEIAARRQDFSRRYHTFAQLQFGTDSEVSCLPREYVPVDDIPAYLMRKANGLSMDTDWATLIDLPLRERYRIAYSLAKALSCLHSREVVHADIKPENFFFRHYRKYGFCSPHAYNFNG